MYFWPGVGIPGTDIDQEFFQGYLYQQSPFNEVPFNSNSEIDL